MDTIINWAGTFFTAHPKLVPWLLAIMAFDQLLKVLKGAFKLNIDDNIFDTIGNVIGKIISKANPPKA